MIQPLGDRVLIEPSEAEDTSAGGIILPEAAQEKPREGKVIAVGPGSDDELINVKEGDIVIYAQYGGTEIRVGDKEYLLIDQDSLLAIKTK